MEKEVSEAERRVVIKRTYSKKINSLLEKDIDDKELYAIIRAFFSEFLKLDYEFTYEELGKELNKVFIKQALKGKIDRMLEDLTILEYTSGTELSQSEKKKILSDFKDVVEELILDVSSVKKQGFFERLFKKKNDLKPQIDSTNASTDVSSNANTASEFSLPNALMNQLPAVDATSANNPVKMPTETPSSSVSLFNNSVNDAELDLMNRNDVKEKNLEMLKALNNEPLKSYDMEDFISEQSKKSSKSRADNNFLLFPNASADTVSTEKTAAKNSKKNTYSRKNNINKTLINADTINVNNLNAINSASQSNTAGNYLEIEETDFDIIRIKTIIEECYNAKMSDKMDDAKKHYMLAIKLYNKLAYEKQTKLYLELYDLYIRLS